MKRPYQIASIVFLLFSAFVVWQSRELEYFTSVGPGPGFFPFWLGTLLGGLSLNLLYQASFRPSKPMPPDFFASRSGYLRVLAVLLALAFSAKFMDALGFRPSMFMFSLFLLFALGRQNIFVALLFALASSWGTYHVFAEWLHVALPIGMFAL